ncbi:MaoC family dehydratase [Streptomyces huasconensis]|uniref:MaoC family dehydratase n=1 Tax=Streptomyces huasconensis TaxID=1854574 RepID=UPI003F4D1C2D
MFRALGGGPPFTSGGEPLAGVGEPSACAGDACAGGGALAEGRAGGALRVGEELPALEIPITRTLIVAGAIASRDYQDVHHDAELAKAKGSPDIFMNILTTNGLVGRYITDRFGPTAVLRKVAIRLGAPNHPGDTMVLRGTVVAVDSGPDGVTATVKVVGTNGIGKHVTGTVTVTLPPGGAA